LNTLWLLVAVGVVTLLLHKVAVVVVVQVVY
jgi:hypothetical protein